MSVLLTLKEVAELENKDYYTITKQVQRKKLKAIKIDSNVGQGFEYRVPLSVLSEKTQAKYYARLNNETINHELDDDKEIPDRYEQELDELTGEQRDQIAFWKRVIKEWRNYIDQFPKQKTVKTKEFIQLFNATNPENAISERTLRNKWKLLREYGEIALADHRKNRKDRGTNTIPPELWDLFLQWWLDENEPSVAYIYKLIESFVKLEMPQLMPIPSYDTFYRASRQIPQDVIKWLRKGEKVFTDECLPYIQRIYDGIYSNEIWTSDYHTLDLFVRDDLTGKIYRPHAVVWADVRSRKILSLSLCETSNSDGVITSFKKAAKAYGLPNNVYLDNGREYLVRDFGGRGKRRSDKKSSYGTTMLERLEIEMINSRVRNGRAKVIERGFKQFSEEFSKLYLTYTGGSPDKRPERHVAIMKDEKNIPLRSEVEKQLWTYIEGWYNCRKSYADGLNGQTPNECYETNLIKKRTATQEQLDSIMLRTSRMQTVNRNGVYLKFGDRKIWFYDTELVHNFLGHKVYVCYDSEDLSKVIVRDEEERKIGTAYLKETGGYSKEMDKQAIKNNLKLEKERKNKVHQYLEQHTGYINAPDPLEVLLKAAQHNIDNSEHKYEAKVLEPLAFQERELAFSQVAVGSDEDVIDFDKMISSARKRSGKR